MSNTTVTRRWFNRLLGASALAAGLAFGTWTTSQAADKELTLFEWAGYEDTGFHQAYIDKHGDSPAYAFFGDEEEAFQKLRAGFKADIMHPCTQSLRKWQDAKLLKPIDTSRIPAWDKIIPALKDISFVQSDGKVWFIPVDWGNTALVYHSKRVSADDVSSLQSFVDPKFKGKISVGDNVDDAYALGFLATGVKDWTKATDEQFKAASDFIRKVHKNVKFYWAESTTLNQAMASGEVDLAWAWNETPTTMKAEGHPVVMNKDTEEGLSTWVCGFVLLKDGEGSEDKAYDYINAFLSQAAATYMVDAWGYGHSNGAAMTEIGEEKLAEKGYSNVSKFMAASLFQEAPEPSMREKMIAEFEKIKAGF